MRERALCSKYPQGCVQLILLGAHERIDPGSLADAVDVAVVQVVQAAGQPVAALADEHQIEDAGEVVQVLADVVEAHDLGRFRERRMPISGAVAATLLAVEQPSISADIAHRAKADGDAPSRSS
jgi:hypothetical protein